MDRWVGKVALITGASSGIGAATAVSLANSGLKVVGAARRVERIEELKKQVTGKGELHALKCDVSKEEDIKAIFNWIKNNLGAIHVLINNAGIVRFGKLAEQDPKFMREVLEVNVMGLTICTQEALKLMKETGVDDGHIIHINSVCGHSVPFLNMEPGFSVYPASKYAVTALTETLRQELCSRKSKIKVTSISPGYVETEISLVGFQAVGAAPPKETAELVANFPSMKSQDIADAILYVLSTPPHVQVHEMIIKPVGEMC